MQGVECRALRVQVTTAEHCRAQQVQGVCTVLWRWDTKRLSADEVHLIHRPHIEGLAEADVEVSGLINGHCDCLEDNPHQHLFLFARQLAAVVRLRHPS